MSKSNVKPLLVIKNFNLASWRNKQESIYLNSKGEIFCDSFIIKDFTRARDYKRMYSFTQEYLEKKHKGYDITTFYTMTIGDLRQIMWGKDIKSISRKRIEEIVHWENQIGNIKSAILERVKKYIVNQIYKENAAQ